MPPLIAGEIAIDGGEEPEDLHVTLAFLGKADDIPDRERLLKTVWLWAKSQSALTGRLNGGGWFANEQTVLRTTVSWRRLFGKCTRRCDVSNRFGRW